MPENVVELKNITKTFRLSEKQNIFSFIKNFHSKKNEKITALDNVSFSVKKGEILGIIGVNGSGKSTLLQIIAGIYQPDSGEVHVSGSLTPIMNIGTGFRPELIPRENIVMYGMLLGISKPEIENEVKKILQFSGLEKFSTMKLEHFSTGMRTRLGLSTIFQLRPEILLLDEVLAVGDISFHQKCIETFSSFKEEGRTILYTSHNLGVLPNFCDKVLLLHQGKSVMMGKPEDVIKKYREMFKKPLKK